MNNLQFYVFSGLLSPEYKTRICLAGPFLSVEAALAATKKQNWANWIIEKRYTANKVEQIIELSVPFDIKDEAYTNYRVVEE